MIQPSVLTLLCESKAGEDVLGTVLGGCTSSERGTFASLNRATRRLANSAERRLSVPSHVCVAQLPYFAKFHLLECLKLTERNSGGQPLEDGTLLQALESKAGGCVLRRLKSLDIKECSHLSACAVTALLSHSSNLEHLALGRWACSATLLGFPQSFTAKLKKLDLGDTEVNIETINDAALYVLCSSCRSLQCLNLSRCVSITDAGLSLLSALSSLKELNISGCSSISQLPSLPALQALDASSCSMFGDAALEAMARGHAPALRHLTLARCTVTNDGLSALCQLPCLEYLDLGPGFEANSAGLCHLGRCQALHTLSLGNLVVEHTVEGIGPCSSPGTPRTGGTGSGTCGGAAGFGPNSGRELNPNSSSGTPRTGSTGSGTCGGAAGFGPNSGRELNPYSSPGTPRTGSTEAGSCGGAAGFGLNAGSSRLHTTSSPGTPRAGTSTACPSLSSCTRSCQGEIGQRLEGGASTSATCPSCSSRGHSQQDGAVRVCHLEGSSRGVGGAGSAGGEHLDGSSRGVGSTGDAPISRAEAGEVIFELDAGIRSASQQCVCGAGPSSGGSSSTAAGAAPAVSTTATAAGAAAVVGSSSGSGAVAGAAPAVSATAAAAAAAGAAAACVAGSSAERVPTLFASLRRLQFGNAFFTRGLPNIFPLAPKLIHMTVKGYNTVVGPHMACIAEQKGLEHLELHGGYTLLPQDCLPLAAMPRLKTLIFVCCPLISAEAAQELLAVSSSNLMAIELWRFSGSVWTAEEDVHVIRRR